jgi:hypothetical protein
MGPVLILIKFVCFVVNCVLIHKCVFIVVKIKCVNSGRISDICDKVNFTTKLHTFYNTRQIFYQNTYNILSNLTQILQFLTPSARRSCYKT